MILLFLFILLFLLPPFITPSPASASSVVINELSPGTNADWVEVYNTTDQHIDLSSFNLVDQTGNEKTFSCQLAPHGFHAVDWSNRLNNAGDTISLKSSGQVIDCLAYGNGDEGSCQTGTAIQAPSADQTVARMPDGSDTWKIVSQSTKDNPNDGSQKQTNAICSVPSPTLVPTDVPTPTKTPSPTKTPTPSRTPTPEVIPTNTPAVSSTTSTVSSPKPPTKKPTPAVLGEETNESNPTISLDVVDATNQETATPTGELTEESRAGEREKGKGAILPLILIVIGGILTLGFGTPLAIQELRSRRKKA